MEENTGNIVLDFYKALPFNYYGSVEAQADLVVKLQSVESFYPPLDKLIPTRKNILEIGCGAGWMANSIAYHYKKKVVGVDFNPYALERAQQVAEQLGLDNEFLCSDLFEFSRESAEDKARFDLIVSLGVLHHTDKCLEAIKIISKNLLASNGYFFIGLYHKFGRKPFLDYFEDLKSKNLNENEIFLKYKELHNLKDDTLLKSWFRDQVMHPHETQHTIEEIIGLLEEINCGLISTSINKFEEISNVLSLVEMEKNLSQISKDRLREKKYFPGFFVFLIQKK